MEAMYFVVVNSYLELQFLRRRFNGCSLYLYLYILYPVSLFIFEFMYVRDLQYVSHRQRLLHLGVKASSGNAILSDL